MQLINWKVLSHPVNFGIVWVVLLLAATAYTFVHDGIRDNPPIIPD
jgi:hypothetical protein